MNKKPKPCANIDCEKEVAYNVRCCSIECWQTLEAIERLERRGYRVTRVQDEQNNDTVQ